MKKHHSAAGKKQRTALDLLLLPFEGSETEVHKPLLAQRKPKEFCRFRILCIGNKNNLKNSRKFDTDASKTNRRPTNVSISKPVHEYPMGKLREV